MSSDWNERVEKKLDSIVEDIGEMKITSAQQHVVLKEHIRRTELLEEDMRPIKKHVYLVEGAVKFIGFLGVVAGIIEVILWMARR